MKVLVPLFAFFALASAQLQDLYTNLTSPTQNQKFAVGDTINANITSNMMLPQQTLKIFIYPCEPEVNGGCHNTSYDLNTVGSVYDDIYDQGSGNQTFTLLVPEINRDLNGNFLFLVDLDQTGSLICEIQITPRVQA